MPRAPLRKTLYIILDQQNGIQEYDATYSLMAARMTVNVLNRAPCIKVHGKLVPRFRIEKFRWVPTVRKSK